MSGAEGVDDASGLTGDSGINSGSWHGSGWGANVPAHHEFEYGDGNTGYGSPNASQSVPAGYAAVAEGQANAAPVNVGKMQQLKM